MRRISIAWPEMSQPARNSRGSDHRGRQGGWPRPTHHGVGTLLRGMDVLRLAGLRSLRDGRAAPDGECPHLYGAMRCSPWWTPVKTTLMPLITPNPEPGQVWRGSRSKRNDSSAKAVSLRQNQFCPSMHQPPGVTSYSSKLQPSLPWTKSTTGRSVAYQPKNTLHAADALLIEDAFRKKLTELRPLAEPPRDTLVPQVPSPSELTAEAPALPATQLPDFEHYAVTPRPRRLRDKLHREFVAAQPCLVCGRQPSDAIICASHNPGPSVAK